MTSTDQKIDSRTYDMLENMLLRGVRPDKWTLHELGFGAKFLEEITRKAKNLLWDHDYYRPLQKTMYPESGVSSWGKLVEAVPCRDVPCLRLTSGRYDDPGSPKDSAILWLPSKEGSGNEPVELFVTASGEWIVFARAKAPDEDDFTICRTVEALCVKLEELAGDTRKYILPYPYTYLIAKALVKSVKADVARKKSRIAYQEATLTEIDAFEKDHLGSK